MEKLVRKDQLARVGEIPMPPNYGSGDFLQSSYWKLRGKLDVPKERRVLYPGMEGGHDTLPVIAWADWDHAQQAQALTDFYQQAIDTKGWEPQKLAPLLAALKERNSCLGSTSGTTPSTPNSATAFPPLTSNSKKPNSTPSE